VNLLRRKFSWHKTIDNKIQTGSRAILVGRGPRTDNPGNSRDIVPPRIRIDRIGQIRTAVRKVLAVQDRDS
jgi:hypothetical protein